MRGDQAGNAPGTGDLRLTIFIGPRARIGVICSACRPERRAPCPPHNPRPRITSRDVTERRLAVVGGLDDHVSVAGALFVIVSGPPASGKSTIAPPLASQLGLPLIAKDTIKDALMSVLPVPDIETSRQVGRGAVAAMLAVAAESPVGAVIESNFYRSVAGDVLRRLPGHVIEVFCRCQRSTAVQRYETRAGTRHAGHFDGIRSQEELWNEEVAKPVAGGWPVLEVNTEAPVNLDEVVAFIRAEA
jgi:predicted kinase